MDATRRPVWELTHETMGALTEVHARLGPGLLEPVYALCLAEELRFRGIRFLRQFPITVRYRKAVARCAYQVDMIVDGQLLLELKSVDALEPVHVVQTRTYLTLLRLEYALLVNFNVPTLRDGIRRVTRDIEATTTESPDTRREC